MEFNEKLQQLRKQKGITQEELAEELFVSRTAVSKWESGRGYPNIESLKEIAKYFSVTVDELLSGEELINIAEADGKQKENHIFDLVFGLLDIAMGALLFLPFFAQRTDGVILASSLLSLKGVRQYLKIGYLLFVISSVVFGILTLAFQNCEKTFWCKNKKRISLIFNVLCVLLFVLGLQPYAAVFSFTFLAVKAFILLKRK